MGRGEAIFYLHEWWYQWRTGARLWQVLPSWILESSEFLSCSSNSELLCSNGDDWRQREFVFTRREGLFWSIYLSWCLMNPPTTMLPRWLSLAQCLICSEDFLPVRRRELAVCIGDCYCPEDCVAFWVKQSYSKSGSTLGHLTSLSLGFLNCKRRGWY